MTEYENRLQHEIAHYEGLFGDRMSYDVPLVWTAVEERFSDLIERATGVRNLYSYVARHVKGRESVRVLGLGSGPCGPELDGIAPVVDCPMELTCVDISEKLLETAALEAGKRSVPFQGIVQDINSISLDEASYDVIVAYASLHHFVEMDHVASQIANGLTADGIFVTVDIPTRNGYLMWDETLEVVNSLWSLLPPQYKIDHTHFEQPTYVARYENIDYSVDSFECANSEQILPSLRQHLQEVHFVPALSIARRFFDTRFGPNYDLGKPLDRAIFDFAMALDEHCIQTKTLKPETFFGAYRRF